MSYIKCRVDGGEARVAAPAEVAWCDRLDPVMLVPSALHEPMRVYLETVLHPRRAPIE